MIDIALRDWIAPNDDRDLGQNDHGLVLGQRSRRSASDRAPRRPPVRPRQLVGAVQPSADDDSPGNLALASDWRSDILVENHRSCGVRNDRYVFIRHNTGEEELYDLTTDPYQLSNLLHGAPTAEIATLREQLLARLRTLCQPPPPGVTI